jgi:hypothetical protein
VYTPELLLAAKEENFIYFSIFLCTYTAAELAGKIWVGE